MKREADRNRRKKRVANVGGLRKTKAERANGKGKEREGGGSKYRQRGVDDGGEV